MLMNQIFSQQILIPCNRAIWEQIWGKKLMIDFGNGKRPCYLKNTIEYIGEWEVLQKRLTL